MEAGDGAVRAHGLIWEGEGFSFRFFTARQQRFALVCGGAHVATFVKDFPEICQWFSWQHNQKNWPCRMNTESAPALESAFRQEAGKAH